MPEDVARSARRVVMAAGRVVEGMLRQGTCHADQLSGVGARELGEQLRLLWPRQLHPDDVDVLVEAAWRELRRLRDRASALPPCPDSRPQSERCNDLRRWLYARQVTQRLVSERLRELELAAEHGV
jgi:hypothetical protein